jgi:adenylate cyclase class 2
MAIEVEAKFLNIDIDDVRSKLSSIGAQLEHPMRLMRRDMFDYPDNRFQVNGGNSERLRIRDEGDKVTITYKKRTPETNYPLELETTLGSYDDAKQLLQAIGLHTFSYQESKRETWHLDSVEVVIDEWPWANPYIEIEGPSEKEIIEAAVKLGFDWKDAKFGSVDTVYMAQYPKMTSIDSIGEVASVIFDAPLPQYLEDRR